MKAPAALLVAAALVSLGAWSADLPAGATRMLVPSENEVQPTQAAVDVRVNFGARSHDVPTPFPPRLHPYDAIGRIEDVRRTKSGTGFLIGPCTVLTAYHVLFAPGEKPSTKAKFTFALGHGGNAEFALVMRARPLFWGEFSYAEDTPTEDFAVLDVPSCPGRRFPPIALDPMSLGEIEQSGGKLQNAGYPIGHSRGRVWGDEDCLAGGMHPLEPVLFAVNCYARRGMSGGPVLAEKDGRLVAIAIMSRAASDSILRKAVAPAAGATSPDLTRYSAALPVSEFLARLRSTGLIDR
jgi:V8-like Glu-specific endopeptidase